MERSDTIKISIDYDGEIHNLETFPNEYRSLMALIFDRIAPEDFGECLGMGKCATCMIEILNKNIPLTNFDRNEQTTLRKHGISKESVRLSCQIEIDENLNHLEIKILT